MGLISGLVIYLTPIFLITSPVTSYADQIFSIHRTRTSAGFSLDIPLIMLLASVLKIFYWPGARFDPALLIQAAVMIVMQLILLKVALDNRPGHREAAAAARGGLLAGGDEKSSGWLGSNGAAGHDEGISTAASKSSLSGSTSGAYSGSGGWMPAGFWRWRQQEPYWQFLAAFVLGLTVLHILLEPSPDRHTGYTTLLGALGLTIEATLPLPQLYSNWASRSCRGFRVSVLANWLVGDAMKMSYFFLQGNDTVTWPFKACGVFQALCDLGLGLQYYAYGNGPDEDTWREMMEREKAKEGRAG